MGVRRSRSPKMSEGIFNFGKKLRDEGYTFSIIQKEIQRSFGYRYCYDTSVLSKYLRYDSLEDYKKHFDLKNEAVEDLKDECENSQTSEEKKEVTNQILLDGLKTSIDALIKQLEILTKILEF